MKDGVNVTVYRWAGKKWFLRIKGECIECDLTVSQVRSLIARNPGLPIEMEVKPWLSCLWESLRRGGWHPPVVLVEGKLVRQGTVPTLAELQAAVRRSFEAKRTEVKEDGSRFLQDRKPTEERGDCPAAIVNRKAFPRQ
jgi:hypothetical protein